MLRFTSTTAMKGFITPSRIARSKVRGNGSSPASSAKKVTTRRGTSPASSVRVGGSPAGGGQGIAPAGGADTLPYTSGSGAAVPMLSPSSSWHQTPPPASSSTVGNNTTAGPSDNDGSLTTFSQRVARRLSFVLSPYKAALNSGNAQALRTSKSSEMEAALEKILIETQAGGQGGGESAVVPLAALKKEARTTASWQCLARIVLNLAAAHLAAQQLPAVVENLQECVALHCAMGNAGAVVHIRSLLASTLERLAQKDEALAQFKLAATAFINGNANSQQCAPGLFYVQPLALRKAVVPYISFLIEQNAHKDVEHVVSQILSSNACSDGDKLQAFVMLARSKRKAGLFQQAADILFACCSVNGSISAAVEHAYHSILSNSARQLFARESGGDDPSSFPSASRLEDDRPNNTTPSSSSSSPSPSRLDNNDNNSDDDITAAADSHAAKELRQIAVTALSELARTLQYNLQRGQDALLIYEGIIDELAKELRSSCAMSSLHHRSGKKPSRRRNAQFEHSAPPERLVVQLTRILYDAAVCHTTLDPVAGHAKALGIYEHALSLLTSSSLSSVSARIRLNFARSLRAVDLVDKALEQYAVIESILMVHGDKPQISENGLSATLPLGELNAHLAHCLHYNIGDLVRAEKYYTRALNISGVEDFSKTIFERVRRSNDESSGDGPVVATIPSVNPFPSIAMRADVVCWLCESYAQLLLRIGDYEQAKTILQWRVSVGMLHADTCIPAYMALCQALEYLREHDSLSEIYHRLLQLPTDAMSTLARLDIVTRYAYHCHYTLQEYDKAAALYAIALEFDATKPQLLSQYASCLCLCSESNNNIDVSSLANGKESASFSSPSGLEGIRALYLRALELTEIRIQDALHHSSMPQAPAETRMVDFEPAFVYADSAVFFHDKMKDANVAAELYEKVWECAGDKPHLVEIVAQAKANYAQLLFYDKGNRLDAEAYFREAIRMSPTTFNIYFSYVDFLVSTSQEDKALEMLTEMCQKFPTHSPQIYHRIARLEDKADNGNSSVENLDERLRLYCIANGAPSDIKEISSEYIVSLLENYAQDGSAATDLVSFIHGRMHNYTLAHQCYRIVVPKFPMVPTLLANYARFCSDHLHKPAIAKKFLTRAMQLNPADATLVELLSELIAQHFPEEMATAEGLMEHATRQHPNNAAVHQSYAMFLTNHLSSPRAADVQFRRAIALKPKDAALRSIYAAFLERQFYASRDATSVSNVANDAILNLTMKMFDEAEALDGQCATAHFLRAVSLTKRQRLSEAWLSYQKSLTLEPNNPQIVKVAATFVHDRYVTISNNIVLSGRTAAPHEGAQLVDLSSLAQALYCKAIRLEGGQDPMMLLAFARFQEEVLMQPTEAKKTSDVAYGMMQRAEESAAKKVNLDEADPDDLLA